MFLGLGLRLGGGIAAPTIQITTAAYLDPELLLVGVQIQTAYVAGVYPDYNGTPVTESSIVYYVDDVEVAATYVLQVGDVVGAALVELTAGTATRLYYAEPTDITDFSYNTADFTFTVPAGSGDTTAPTISSSSPADNDTEVAIATNITITFSETVQFGTGNIVLRHNNGGWADLETFDVATEQGTSPGQVSISGATLTIRPTSALVYSREYAIRIAGTAITDTSSNLNAFAGVADDTTLSFTTGAEPVISSTSPADNATGVAVDTSPTITFNKAIAFGTGNITLRENNGGWADLETFDVATEQGTGNGQVSISGSVLTINPTASLVNGREYAIRIASTAIDDTFGNSFAGIADDTTISFTAVVGLAIQSSGAILNTATDTTTPTALGTITMTAGDLLVIVIGATRATNGSAISASGTWNGESITEQAVLRHAGGRIAGHILTLVAASSGTFTPTFTFTQTAASCAADYYVIRGQTGSPVKQNASNSANVVNTLSATITAPAADRIILGFGVQRYTTATAPSTLTVSAPLTILGSSVRTGTSNNLDCLFASGYYTTPNTSNVTTQVNSDGAGNFLIMAAEIG